MAVMQPGGRVLRPILAASIALASCAPTDAMVVFDTSQIDLRGGDVLVSGRAPGQSCATIMAVQTTTEPWNRRSRGDGGVFEVARTLAIDVAVWREREPGIFRSSPSDGPLDAIATLLGTAHLQADDVTPDGCTLVRFDPPPEAAAVDETTFVRERRTSCGPRLEDRWDGDVGMSEDECWCTPGAEPDATDNEPSTGGTALAWIEPLKVPAICER